MTTRIIFVISTVNVKLRAPNGRPYNGFGARRGPQSSSYGPCFVRFSQFFSIYLIDKTNILWYNKAKYKLNGYNTHK